MAIIRVNIFDTEQKAIDAQESDYQELKAEMGKIDPEFREKTKSWDKVIKHPLADLWGYRVCTNATVMHPQADFDTELLLQEDGEI